MRRPKLPGSAPDETGGAGTGAGGRLTADEWGALGEVAAWWRNRQAVGDSAAPLESHFGGVDLVGTARTVGTLPAVVEFGRPLLPTAAGALLVLAFGLPDPPDDGEPVSLVGLCHFRDGGEAGWLGRYVTLGRAPASAASAEVSTAVELGSGAPVVVITGVEGQVLAWRVEVLRVERG